MSNPYNHTGIECTLGWFDSPDSADYVTVFFGDAPEADGDEPVYCINETEVNWLYKCIAERRDKCAFGKDWYIDLTDEYFLIVNETINQSF